MRTLVLAVALAALGACAAQTPVTTSTLAAADAATQLAVGQQIFIDRAAPQSGGDGMDPLIAMALRHADGRSMQFQEANHTPYDVMAQAPGGPLAQVMGLFGEEAPKLYHATPAENRGAPFICGAEGPRAIGIYEAPDGTTQIVGLRQTFQFEQRPDGQSEAVPFSPDQVCARLSFRRS